MKDLRNTAPFIIGKQYSRKDIYSILQVPADKQRGNWETGYRKYNEAYYVFVNVETPGRTGHNYNDRWLPDGTLLWHGKNNTRINQPAISEMISNRTPCHFFTRTDNKNIYFTYQGVGKSIKSYNMTPVEVIWEFPMGNVDTAGFGDVLIQKYSPRISTTHRNKCLAHFGTACYVCGIDFGTLYGSLGEGYIRVNFLNPGSREKLLSIDPIMDLRPVCPNCIAMLMRRPNALISMDELKEYIANAEKT